MQRKLLECMDVIFVRTPNNGGEGGVSTAHLLFLGLTSGGRTSLYSVELLASLPLPPKQLYHQYTTICRQSEPHHLSPRAFPPSAVPHVHPFNEAPGRARSLASCSSYLSYFSCLSSSCLFHVLSVCLPPSLMPPL